MTTNRLNHFQGEVSAGPEEAARRVSVEANLEGDPYRITPELIRKVSASKPSVSYGPKPSLDGMLAQNALMARLEGYEIAIRFLQQLMEDQPSDVRS